MGELEELIKIYKLSDEKFKEYKGIAKIALTTGKIPSKDKKLIIVGGQSGAGKSRIIPVAKQELANNAVIVDFDELRSMNPYYKDVTENYPEIMHKILHSDTNKAKEEILEDVIEEGYNVIYEGALRDTKGFIELAKKFKNGGYTIKMEIMATPKLESYGSTFLRYATALLTDVNPRWVEKFAHDSSYDGVIKTVEEFYNQNLIDEIDVFVRNLELPRKIYEEKNGKNSRLAIGAINYGRENGRRNAVNQFSTKYQMVKYILEQKDPERLKYLEDWKELYESEVEYFNTLNKGGEELDD